MAAGSFKISTYESKNNAKKHIVWDLRRQNKR